MLLRGGSRMRMAAFVLGLVGGIVGMATAFAGIALGTHGSVFLVSGSGAGAGPAIAALFVAMAAIVGGALAHRAPNVSWVLLLLTGLGGFMLIGAMWILAGVLLVVGGVLEFVAPKQQDAPLGDA
jgi:hypothetical protein